MRAAPGAALVISLECKLLLLQSVTKVGLQLPKLEDISVILSQLYQYFKDTLMFGYSTRRIVYNNCGPSQINLLSPFCLYVLTFR